MTGLKIDIIVYHTYSLCISYATHSSHTFLNNFSNSLLTIYILVDKKMRGRKVQRKETAKWQGHKDTDRKYDETEEKVNTKRGKSMWETR